MKTLADIYTRQNRGPWLVPRWMLPLMGNRELAIMHSRTTDMFPHRLNRDCDFYLSDDCTTWYCPDNGSFTVRRITTGPDAPKADIVG